MFFFPVRLLIHILAVCFWVRCLAAINKVPLAHQLSRCANFLSGKHAVAVGRGKRKMKAAVKVRTPEMVPEIRRDLLKVKRNLGEIFFLKVFLFQWLFKAFPFLSKSIYIQ